MSKKVCETGFGQSLQFSSCSFHCRLHSVFQSMISERDKTMNPTGVLLIIPVFSRHIISLYNVSVSILQNLAKLFMSNERDIS